MKGKPGMFGVRGWADWKVRTEVMLAAVSSPTRSNKILLYFISKDDLIGVRCVKIFASLRQLYIFLGLIQNPP